MSSQDSSRPKLKLPPPSHYDVGFAKPPVANRFKPGTSGNPKGRPKGAKGKKNDLPVLGEERLSTAVFAAAGRHIKVRENDKTITLTMADAILRSLTVNAAKGNNRSAALFMQMLKVSEEENKARIELYVKSAVEYKWKWDEELARRRKLGLPPPDDLYPHPDHIIIDYNKGTVSTEGPITKEQAEMNQKVKDRLDNGFRSLTDLHSTLAKTRHPKKRELIQHEIETEQDTLTSLINAMPDWLKREWVKERDIVAREGPNIDM